MATLTTSSVGATVPAKSHGLAGTVKAAYASYSLSAALALNDVIQMVKVPKGAPVLDVELITTDLDTGGSPAITLHVGYGGDADYFIASSTVGQGGGVARASAATAKPLAFTDEDTIDVTVAVAPATGATTGTVSLVAYYVVP